jgi:hypothetical protein
VAKKKLRRRQISTTTTQDVTQFGAPGTALPRSIRKFTAVSIDITLPVGGSDTLPSGTTVTVEGPISTNSGVTLAACYTSPGGTVTDLPDTPTISSDGMGGWKWSVPMLVPSPDPSGDPYTFTIEATFVVVTKGGGSITVVNVSAAFPVS